MQTKGFTLTEMLIVIIIMGFFLFVITGALSDRVTENDSRLDREKLESTFLNAVANSMASSYFEWQRYEEYIIELYDENINYFWIRPWGDKDEFETKNFEISYFSGIQFQGNTFSTWKFIMEPYNQGCEFEDIHTTTRYSTWEVSFEIDTDKNWINYCFDLQLDSCSLSETCF